MNGGMSKLDDFCARNQIGRPFAFEQIHNGSLAAVKLGRQTYIRCKDELASQTSRITTPPVIITERAVDKGPHKLTLDWHEIADLMGVYRLYNNHARLVYTGSAERLRHRYAGWQGLLRDKDNLQGWGSGGYVPGRRLTTRNIANYSHLHRLTIGCSKYWSPSAHRARRTPLGSLSRMGGC